MQVGIYLFPDAEVLDFAGPFEVFTTAARLAGAPPPFRSCLIGEHGGPVRARGGMVVQPHHGFDDHPPLDVLIVAGGVHEPEMDRPRVREWIAARAAGGALLASVCTGVFLLARAGVLGACRVTTHHEDIAELRRLHPELEVVEGVRWVDAGDRVTSGGISAGIDMSLHLVERLAGPQLAERTARQMEFARSPDSRPRIRPAP
jgi:transcriptional regulator GlxA family with amidase domain